MSLSAAPPASQNFSVWRWLFANHHPAGIALLVNYVHLLPVKVVQVQIVCQRHLFLILDKYLVDKSLIVSVLSSAVLANYLLDMTQKESGSESNDRIPGEDTQSLPNTSHNKSTRQPQPTEPQPTEPHTRQGTKQRVSHALDTRPSFTNCERVGGVQGVLTLICDGVAQTCHDDRVVELKEQLVVEEVDGEGQEGKVKEEGRGRIKESAPRR